jgi:hypothetical protein
MNLFREGTLMGQEHTKLEMPVVGERRTDRLEWVSPVCRVLNASESESGNLTAPTEYNTYS